MVNEPLLILAAGTMLAAYSAVTIVQQLRTGSVSLKYGRFSRDTEPGRFRFGLVANIVCLLIGAGLAAVALYVLISPPSTL